MPQYANQHFVPRFLLESWHSPPDDKLTAYRWQHGKLISSRRKAKSVARIEHLYSMRRSKELPDVEVERDFLGPQVDEPASLVHKRLMEVGVNMLGDAERERWAAFLVSLMVRGPSMMRHMRNKGRKILGAGLANANSTSADGETLLEWVHRNEPDALDDVAVRSLPHVIRSELLNGAVLRSKWAVRSVERSRFELLIGDHPLIYAGTLESVFLIGLPLSPKRAFVASNDDKSMKKVMSKSHESFAVAMNLSTLSRAEAYVFAANQQQESFVRKRLVQPVMNSQRGAS